MCSQSLKMLGSKKHLDMYLLDIFNKQSDLFPIPHSEVRHLVSVLGALLITKQRCSGVTRADVSARGAEVVSAQLIRCVRARRQCTKPGVVWLLRTAPGWRVFLQRKLEHSYTLDHWTWHRDTTTYSTLRQSSAQCRSWSTRPWHAPGHVAATRHTPHITHVASSVFCYLQLFFFKWQQIPMPNIKLQGSQQQKHNCIIYSINVM